MTARRQFWLRWFAAAHFVALALWAAALISTGVAAAGAFSTLPDLGISLEPYSSYEAGKTDVHGRLAAGHMLEPIFAAMDMAQVALGVLALATLVAWILLSGERIGRPSLIFRLAALAVAAILLIVHLTAVAPAMNRELRAYWAAAKAGDVSLARTRHEAFDQYHPRAETILKVNLALVLAALAAGAWATGAPARSALEPPLLSRRTST